MNTKSSVAIKVLEHRQVAHPRAAAEAPAAAGEADRVWQCVRVCTCPCVRTGVAEDEQGKRK